MRGLLRPGSSPRLTARGPSKVGVKFTHVVIHIQHIFNIVYRRTVKGLVRGVLV